MNLKVDKYYLLSFFLPLVLLFIAGCANQLPPGGGDVDRIPPEIIYSYPEDGTTNYDNQANQSLAKNLKGKLLLAHGTMDTNVPMYNTLLVVNELIAANKDFDLILFPNRGHGFGNEPYMMRRRWDYFVKHLLGAEPPEAYKFKFSTSRR